MSTYGLNILMQQRDSGALFPYLAKIKPRWCVVMDDHALALRMREQGYGVIFRAYRPDDARLHETMQPAQFVHEYARLANNGIVLQVLNEPVAASQDGAQRLSAWITEVIRIAPRHMRLCVANFAMGNPHEDLISRGAFDGILRALRPSIDLLGLHEYAKRGDISQWFVGRYRNWLQRAKVLKLFPEIVITECGYDIGGGSGDGWRAHIGAQDYATLLKRMGDVYRSDGVAACIYSWGDGFSWGMFNIEGEREIMSALLESNLQAASPSVGEWVPRILTVTADAVNMRAVPNTSSRVIKSIRRVNGELRIEWGGLNNGWQRIRLADGTEGYMSAQFVTLKELPIQSEGVFVQLPELFFASREEASRHIEYVDAYLNAIRARLSKLAS